ncbi:MAG: tetratricopeptide repeat protein [Candidatus Hodarchaeota archaeon]
MTIETLTVVGVFDEELGLVPIWNSPLLSMKDDIPYIIAVKSLSSIMIQEGSEVGEMIIPFPSGSLYGFVYYFTLGSTPVSITFALKEELQDLLYKKRQSLSLSMHTFVQKLKQEPSHILPDFKIYIQNHGSNLAEDLVAVLLGIDISPSTHFFPPELRVHATRLSPEESNRIETQFPVKEKPPFLKEFVDGFITSISSEEFQNSKELRYLFAKSCYIRGLYDRILTPFQSFDVSRPPSEPFSIWYAASIYRKGDPATAIKVLSSLSFENDPVSELERLGFLAFIFSGGLSQHKKCETYAFQAIKQADKSQISFELQASLIARCGLAISYYLRGLFTQVKEVIDLALEIASHVATSDRYWKAWLLNVLSISQEHQGIVEEALVPLYQAKDIFEKIDHSQALAIVNNNLANVLFLQGKYDECLSHYETAYLALLGTGDRHNAIKALSNIARVYHRLGRYQESLRFAQRAYEDLVEIGDKAGITEALIRIGKAYRELGEIKKAEEKLKEATIIARVTSNRRALAKAYLEVGEMLIIQDDYLTAEGWLNGALNAFKIFEIKDTSLARCHLLLARCSAYQNHFDEACQQLEKARLIGLSLDSKVIERKCKVEEELIQVLIQAHKGGSSC